MDLATLLKVRKTMTQEEARIIMSMVVRGIHDIWALSCIHRDVRAGNISLNFPDRPELINMDRSAVKHFLAQVDLTKEKFVAKIAEFSFATICDDETKQLSICGTPLYSSP